MRKNDTISEELISLHAFGLAEKHPVPYAIPNGYFDTLASVILNDVKIINTADPVLFYPKELPYKIPATYFDSLPDIALKTVKAADALIIHNHLPWEHTQAIPYQLPQGYFDRLATDILFRVSNINIAANEETEALSPVLSALKHRTSLAVPEGYFESKINTSEPESGKATEHPAARYRRKWWYPAVAAAILILFAFTGWQYFGTQHTNAGNTQMYANDINLKYEKRLAQIPDANIQQYIEANLDEFDENMLSSAVAAVPASGNAANDIFKDIPNSDIEAYLNNM